MNAEELTAKIEANPCLLPHYDNDGEDEIICPHCVSRDATCHDHDRIEKLLDIIIRCSARHKKIKSQIQKVTRNLREELEEVSKEWDDARHELYEIRNSAALSP